MKQITDQKTPKIAVIGGGAAGLFAAAKALEHGADVSIYERNDSVGKKLNITGNGRCNYSNRELSLKHYRNPDFVKPYLAQFPCEYFEDYFASLGILSFREKNGCIYPSSQKAQTITKGLLHYIKILGGNIHCGICVSELNKNSNGFFLLTSKDAIISDVFDAVILACGGKAAPKTGSDGCGFRLARGFGHSVSRTYPVLVQLKSDSKVCKKCQGIRCRVEASSYINNELLRREKGELQITEYGLSGIVTFNLSRDLSKALEEGENCSIYVDFLPELSKENIYAFLLKRFQIIQKDTLLDFLAGLINPKLMEVLLLEKKCDLTQIVSKDNISYLCELLESFKNWQFKITNHNGYENAQVTQGGILLSEVTASLESQKVPNLYFAGEMLDIDADCGGYNLHWAWMSGEITGTAAAKKGF